MVAAKGGAWGRLFPLFKAGLGGRMGDGRQYWSYIALHDHVAALRYLIDSDSLSGPFNLTAPEPLTNREITAAMGRVLHRPTFFAVPAPVLKLVLGEMAQEVLGSQRVLPTRLLESGFTFAFPGIEEAIRAVRSGAPLGCGDQSAARLWLSAPTMGVPRSIEVESGEEPHMDTAPRPSRGAGKPRRRTVPCDPRATVPCSCATSTGPSAALPSCRTRVFLEPVGGHHVPSSHATSGRGTCSSPRIRRTSSSWEPESPDSRPPIG